MLLAVVGCGGTPSVNPPANANATAAAAANQPAAEAAEDCMSSVESAKPGNHDRFAFQGADELYGYKNGKGQVVIAPRLRYAYEFKPGGIAAAVDNDASFVFIDTSGKVIARAYAFDNGPDYFQEGLARIVDVALARLSPLQGVVEDADEVVQLVGCAGDGLALGHVSLLVARSYASATSGVDGGSGSRLRTAARHG